MSQGLRARLLKNKQIYTICLHELKKEDNKYPSHFTYPEALEFSMNFVILRNMSSRYLKSILININRHLKSWEDKIMGCSKKELEKIKRRKFNREVKLNKHLNKLRKLKVQNK